MSAYYESLPIYKVAADLVVCLDTVVRGFSRYHKYSWGARMREKAMELVLLVARCNRKEERLRHVVQLCQEVEEMKILVNMAKEVQAFLSFKQFVQVMERVVGLALQAEGWKKSLSKATRPVPNRPISPGRRS